MVVIASGQGGDGGVGDAGPWCKAGFLGMAVRHNAAHASYKTVKQTFFLSLHN